MRHRLKHPLQSPGRLLHTLNMLEQLSLAQHPLSKTVLTQRSAPGAATIVVVALKKSDVRTFHDRLPDYPALLHLLCRFACLVFQSTRGSAPAVASRSASVARRAGWSSRQFFQSPVRSFLAPGNGFIPDLTVSHLSVGWCTARMRMSCFILWGSMIQHVSTRVDSLITAETMMLQVPSSRSTGH